MVYVRVEHWPDGDRARAQLLQEAVIEDRGTGDRTHGDYRVRLSPPRTQRPAFAGWRDPAHPDRADVVRTSFLLSFRRSRTPLELVFEALGACGFRRA